MAASTVFYQSCPVCGRTLRIPAKYFGRQMLCSHCEGEFRAGNDQLQPPAPAEPAFAEQALSQLTTIPVQLGEV
jgi:hypothetical protein